MIYPFHFRQHSLVVLIDIGIVRLGKDINALLFPRPCLPAVWGQTVFICNAALLFGYFWTLQYYAYISYIIEHKFLPILIREHRKQKENSRLILNACTSNIPYNKECELYLPKVFRQSTIVVLHVKVGDQLSGYFMIYNIYINRYTYHI